MFQVNFDINRGGEWRAKIFSIETRRLHLIAPTVASGIGPSLNLQEAGNLSHHCRVISGIVVAVFFVVVFGVGLSSVFSARRAEDSGVGREQDTAQFGESAGDWHGPVAIRRSVFPADTRTQPAYSRFTHLGGGRISRLESAAHAHTIEQSCGEGHEGSV